MIWKPDVECADSSTLRQIQSRRLERIVRYVYDRNPGYKAKIDAAGCKPSDIKSIDDIRRLPFTTKDDMRDNYPFGLFSVDDRQVAEIHVSSGTTGNPTVVGYTREDIALWSDVMARSFCCTGAEPGDRIQVAYGYGLFTGGLGMHYGALEMGLSIIPMSSGQTPRQLKLMYDFGTRILACTPSYALHMAEEAREAGIDPRTSPLEIGVFGAEPWTEEMRDQIEQAWNIKAYDIYGLSEIIGPGVAQECTSRCGLHVYSDVFYPEVIDPDSGEPVKPGENGELVVTTLTKQAIPLIRYRTRDIVSLDVAPCRCGRTSPRMTKVAGRTDDMIVVRGINVFPSQIEHVLLQIEGTQPHYQLIVDRKAGEMDDLEILVEVEQSFFSDEIRKLEELQQRIRRQILSVLGVSAKITLVEHKTIERSIGKAKRVVDKRRDA